MGTINADGQVVRGNEDNTKAITLREARNGINGGAVWLNDSIPPVMKPPVENSYNFIEDYNNARETAAPITPAYDFMADYNRAVKNRDNVAYLNYIKRYPSPVNDGSRDSGSSGGGFGTRYGRSGGGWDGSSGYQNAWPIDMGLFQWNYRG